MKYFIKKVLLFISIVFCILLCIDFFISKKLVGYTNPSWYNISKNIRYDGIIYGSSRAYMHIDPYVLSDSTNVDFFNYGVVAGRINTIYLKHKTIFSNKTLIPKYLLISLDPFLFCVNNQIQNKKDFLPILLFNFNAYSILNKTEITIPDISIPFYRYISFKKTITKSVKNYIKNEPDYDKGFFNPLSYESSKWTPQDKKYIDELIDISTFPSHELQIQGVSYLREIIEDCKESGTDVIFIYTPLYAEANSIIDRQTMLFHDSIFNTLSKEYNITYLNYKEDSRFSNDYKQFVDFTHLTSSNARNLSLIIADTLQNIFHEKK